MTYATKSEALNVMISVMGKYFMKSPTMPGQNIKGRNAERVVIVDVRTGTNTSPAAAFAA